MKNNNGNINKDNIWTKNCPKCNSIQYYSRKDSLKIAIKNDIICVECNNNLKKCIIPAEYKIFEENGIFYKNCSVCGKKQTYSTRYAAIKSYNTKCYKCSSIGKNVGKFVGKYITEKHKKQISLKNSGKMGFWIGKKFSKKHLENMSISSLKRFSDKNKHPWTGKVRSEEDKRKISKTQIGKFVSVETRQKLKISVAEAWKNPTKRTNILYNCKWKHTKVDKGQLEILDKWNKLGFHFEPNYQIKTDVDLFYIDGYDKTRNVVLEYDSKYHKYNIQKQKDLIRQQKIIDIINPNKFWRYNSENKTWVDVAERVS